eukprot:123307_1
MGACGTKVPKEYSHASQKLVQEPKPIENVKIVKEQKEHESVGTNISNNKKVAKVSITTEQPKQPTSVDVETDNINKDIIASTTSKHEPKQTTQSDHVDNNCIKSIVLNSHQSEQIEDSKQSIGIHNSFIVEISSTERNNLNNLISGFFYDGEDNKGDIPWIVIEICIAFYFVNDVLQDSNNFSDEKLDIYKDSNADIFTENEGTNSWGNSMSLIYSEQQILLKTIDTNKEDETELILKNALERRRLENSDLSKFWKCGKCDFLNHPTLAICMACNLPQADIIYHLLCCDMRNELKTCPNCNAYIIPKEYVDHLTDCQQSLNLYVNNKQIAQSWYVKLTICEKNAITHVQSLAMTKSMSAGHEHKLLQLMYDINPKYGNTETWDKLHKFMEWEVPIIIHVHCAKIIPLLYKDSHYRNLFEINTGYGCTNQDTRKKYEKLMFDDVYDRAKPFERPKYGCLNVGLNKSGVHLARQYGDGYFLINNTTVRWRTTMTIKDSFAVKGNCGTLKHCNHLLTELNKNELKELIESALYAKKGGKQQKHYREVQIHGPCQLNRDIKSLHVPKTGINLEKKRIFEKFVKKNNCKLIWF